MRTWRWQQAAWWTACWPGRPTSLRSCGSDAQLWQHAGAQPLPLKVGQQVWQLPALVDSSGQKCASVAARRSPAPPLDVRAT